jgi:hypothetical protein
MSNGPSGEPTLDTPAGLRHELAAQDWFEPLESTVALPPGATAPAVLRVPAPQAERILRQTIRLVADIPKGSTPQLVWVKGADELLVRTDDVSLACDTGLVTFTVTVACDQLQEPTRVAVPLAVGTAQLPTGLVMSTLSRPVGPALVVDAWAEPISAFAWEALVHLAQSLCAATGSDASGRALVPAAIGAEPRILLVQPAARHAFVRWADLASTENGPPSMAVHA